jgi:anaerobic selenocysteine-containing dehydrogenase
VPESAEWYNAGFLILWGSIVPQTRTPDAHFYTEARYKGTKSVVISPDSSEAAKLGDMWLSPRAGTDSALAMAMGHVILKEFHIERQVPYSQNYIRKSTDMPLLVRLEKRGDSYALGRVLRASDFEAALAGLHRLPLGRAGQVEYRAEERRRRERGDPDAVARLRRPSGAGGISVFRRPAERALSRQSERWRADPQLARSATRNSGTIPAFHSQMQRSKEPPQLGPYVLSRLGAALRDASDDGGRAEQPTRMGRALVELSRLEARTRDRRSRLQDQR